MTITYLPLLNLINRDPWTEQSSCSRAKDPDAWFPTSAAHLRTEPIRICSNCPVIAQCAAEAVSSHEIYGIRAGVYLNGEVGADRLHRDELTAIAEAGGVTIVQPKITHGNAVKTHCKRNHEFTRENTRIAPNGKRGCKQCEKQKERTPRKAPKAVAS